MRTREGVRAARRSRATSLSCAGAARASIAARVTEETAARRKKRTQGRNVNKSMLGRRVDALDGEEKKLLLHSLARSMPTRERVLLTAQKVSRQVSGA